MPEVCVWGGAPSFFESYPEGTDYAPQITTPPPQIFRPSDIPASDMYATFTLGEKCVVSSKGNVSRAELNSRQNLSLMSSIQTNMQLLKIGLS